MTDFFSFFQPGQTNAIHPAKVSFEGEASEAEKSAWPHSGKAGRGEACQGRRPLVSRLSLRMRSGRGYLYGSMNLGKDLQHFIFFLTYVWAKKNNAY